MRARLTEKLLSAKPGAIIYLTKEEWRFMMENPNPPRDPLLVEREKTHGSFAENARIWQTLCHLAKHGQFKNDSQRLAIEMIFLKISRMIQNPNEVDHWNDIAGYAKLGAEACEK